jgi:bifunctional UDP-N-acetylglucosamine pyrophosphorylase/glucosamine-1-phosphate N-acetyltransferase
MRAVEAATNQQPAVVVGYGAKQVQAVFGDRASYIYQPELLGTGDAVRQAVPHLAGKTDLVLVVAGDMPLLSAETLTRLVERQQVFSGTFTMTTALAQDSRGFGRVVRAENGDVRAIVEEAVATPEQLAIREFNVGAYCFRADWLWSALEHIQVSPKGEYYLTDLVEVAVKQGAGVQAIQIDDPAEAIGVNTRVHLAEAGAQLQQRINTAWMLAGVTLVDPRTTYIEPEVQIGLDTTIWPNTSLRGETFLGAENEIGPNTIIQDSRIGARCKIVASVVEEAHLENGVEVGPFAHLRKGAHLADGVHMGNFGEVKNSYLGPGTKMGHFSYIGDATIGVEVNIGAGTITCNYDGVKKSPTHIGDRSFIGSDTMLVAPVQLGEGSRTGAGSVVTKDVPDFALAVGVPARVIRKLEKRE